MRARVMLALACLFVVAGCGGEAFRTSTFEAAGIASGMETTQAECARENSAFWVVYEGKGDCMFYFLSGPVGAGGKAVVYLGGDQMYQSSDLSGRVTDVFPVSRERATRAVAGYAKDTAHLPVILLGRPGTLGSSGDHRFRREMREVQLVSLAIDRLKAKYGLKEINLAGQSGGGHLVASLATVRGDIRCAVSSSGAVAEELRSNLRGWNGAYVNGSYTYYDPIKHVAKIPDKRQMRFILLADPEDKVVPFAVPTAFKKELDGRGIQSVLILAKADGSSHHSLSRKGILAAASCARGASFEEIRRLVGM